MPPLRFKSVALFIVAAASGAYASAAPPPPKEVGYYDLVFIFDTHTNNLVLRAHVTNSNGLLATDGVVIFEYCSYKGLPPRDITRPDEAPSSACADGSGKWIKLNGRGIPVTSNGDALLFFSQVLVVNVIGFRYTYDRGSEIADWHTDPADWVR